jgi:chromosome segregation ATPase
MLDENDNTGLNDKIDDLNDKMTQFSSILEKFGLDLITKLGQTNLKLNKLTDKINELHGTTLDVKSLTPQLNNVIESQKGIKSEIELLTNLISNLKSASIQVQEYDEGIERNEVATDKKEAIIRQLNSLKTEIPNFDDPKSIVTDLEIIKENIFEFTGGHRILYEISQVITRLKSIKSLSDPFEKNKPNSTSTDKYLSEKITFWINKLDIKD